ncbi:MAG: pyridoxal phosphate-dependent aminotransferase [Deltaproteobacteria bacterium]|nr:pyridoxal phosphate-dependent aminotransferase [Deltaproteobacteria bacterium]
MNFALRVKMLKPSPTLSISAKANALKAEGRDIIGFGAGEPDFDTPEHIKEAAIAAIKAGFTKYTAVAGIDELKDAIIQKLQKENGLSYKRAEIVVSSGAKHSLYNIAQVLFEKGDEVIIPGPYWVSYTDIVQLAEATPVIIETGEESGFKVSPDDLEKAMTKRTKAVIFNSPCNPTGATYSESEIRALAEVIASRDVIVISDDIYEKILYDDQIFFNMANVDEELKRKTIVVNGVSKTYAMTGWRIGYAAGSQDIMSQVANIQSQNTSNATSISQKASVAALMGKQDEVFIMVEEFRKRRDYIVSRLNAIEGVRCSKPAGSFYVFPNLSGFYGRRSFMGKKVSGSDSITEYLLEEANVAVVPGAAFGDDRHVRISYATSMANIEKGMNRIADALAKLD